MEHMEMVNLIRAGVRAPGGVWADLGAGTGNFTWALADLLGPTGTIYALDRQARAIAALQARLRDDPPATTILPRQTDVQHPFHLPLLDGILCANLLHFLRDQSGLLQQLHAHLRAGGHLLVVEYEQAVPLPWVPHPLPFTRLTALVSQTGFSVPQQVGVRRSPSSGRMLYAAVAQRT